MNANNSRNSSQTDWAALEAMSDEDIDYSDIPPLTDDFFKNAILRLPAKQARHLVELEPDVLKWFQEQGADYKILVNSALRRYIADHSNQQAS